MGTGHDYFGGYDEVFWVFLAVTVPMVGIALFATEPEKMGVQKAMMSDEYRVLRA